MQKAMYFGADVAKKTFVVSPAQGGDVRAKPTTFTNDKAGFKKCLAWMRSLGRKEGATSYHLCLEATGVYGDRLARFFLAQDGVTVSVINPAQIAAFAKATLARTKTDKADARLIADFALKQKPSVWSPDSPELAELASMTRRFAALQKDLGREKSRLEAETRKGCGSKVVIRSLEVSIKSLKKEMARFEQEINDHVKKHPGLKKEVELLDSVVGIAQRSATRILAEIGGKADSLTVKQIVALSGLSPSHRQSGTSVRGKSLISRKGNRRLRAALYMPAMVAARHNPLIRPFYQKLLQAGKPKKLALVACMKKLLHICYGILKTQTPFDPNKGKCTPQTA